jgi:hypothetical protein
MLVILTPLGRDKRGENSEKIYGRKPGFLKTSEEARVNAPCRKVERD